jgi:hypothetical protein
MENALNFLRGQTGDPLDTPNAQVLRSYQIRLERMRDMVLYERNQRKITQASIDELERDLSNIIGGLDRLRRAPNIDEIHSSLDEVQANVRKARKCLHVASGLLERGNTPRYIDALFEKFEEFSDFLFEAIELLDI